MEGITAQNRAERIRVRAGFAGLSQRSSQVEVKRQLEYDVKITFFFTQYIQNSMTLVPVLPCIQGEDEVFQMKHKEEFRSAPPGNFSS